MEAAASPQNGVPAKAKGWVFLSSHVAAVLGNA
jgi:hypothetical protein